MNILAIECSLTPSSLCLMNDEGALLYHHEWYVDRNHDAELFPALEQCLAILADRPLDLILVGSGPGSYGGVRVALAAAEGISLVRASKIAAIDSWAQLAVGGRDWIISDAKRGGWTLRHPGGLIEVSTIEAINALLAQGERIGSVESAELLTKNDLSEVEAALAPSAQGLVETWLHMTPEAQQLLLDTPPAPIYVRQPHITKAKRKPWECG